MGVKTFGVEFSDLSVSGTKITLTSPHYSCVYALIRQSANIFTWLSFMILAPFCCITGIIPSGPADLYGLNELFHDARFLYILILWACFVERHLLSVSTVKSSRVFWQVSVHGSSGLMMVLGKTEFLDSTFQSLVAWFVSINGEADFIPWIVLFYSNFVFIRIDVLITASLLVMFLCLRENSLNGRSSTGHQGAPMFSRGLLISKDLRKAFLYLLSRAWRFLYFLDGWGFIEMVNDTFLDLQLYDLWEFCPVDCNWFPVFRNECTRVPYVESISFSLTLLKCVGTFPVLPFIKLVSKI